MLKGKGARTAALANRNRYIELRQQGMTQKDAVIKLDLNHTTARRYERWVKAAASGQTITETKPPK
jgi:hypothetical protein